MVLSFFRRNTPPEDEVKQAPPRSPAPPAAQPVAMGGALGPELESAVPMGGIEVVETGASPANFIEEAAIHFASDRADQAIACLVQCLAERPEARELRPWLMLLELYQASGRRQEFEDLAMAFVVKFERSPPAWVERDAAGKTGATANPAGAAVAFAGMLAAGVEETFRELHAAASSGAVRLDLSGLQGIDAGASHRLRESLQALRKAGVNIRHSGVATLVDLLKPAIAAPQSDPAAWLLLLELYLLQGLQQEFEDLAVDYAVAFEVSPPSWERPEKGSAPRKAVDGARGREAAQASGADGFALEGVISPASEARLKELVSYAAGKPQVRIDMSRVTRVDFASVGSLLNAVIEVSHTGRQVFIHGANELTSALLEVTGVGQFATILRKAG